MANEWLQVLEDRKSQAVDPPVAIAPAPAESGLDKQKKLGEFRAWAGF